MQVRRATISHKKLLSPGTYIYKLVNKSNKELIAHLLKRVWLGEEGKKNESKQASREKHFLGILPLSVPV
jgi:hypothetical protein